MSLTQGSSRLLRYQKLAFPSKMLLPTIYFFLGYSALSEAFQIPLSKPGTSPFTPDFDQLVAETLDHWHTPGISVAVVDGDQTFSKVYV